MKHKKMAACLWVEKDAKKVARYYLSVFKKGKLKEYQAYKDSPNGPFDLAYIEILGQEFLILAAGAQFKFNEAVSFIINCKDQAEVDYYWKKLTANGGSEGPCGWLKDKYGLSWQVNPVQLDKLMTHKNKAKRDYAFNAILKMKKIIIADLVA